MKAGKGQGGRALHIRNPDPVVTGYSLGLFAVLKSLPMLLLDVVSEAAMLDPVNCVCPWSVGINAFHYGQCYFLVLHPACLHCLLHVLHLLCEMLPIILLC